MVAVLYVVNVWFAGGWARIQNLLLVVHVLGFMGVVIVLWVLGPRRSARDVFTNFENKGGWGSIGLSLMVGQITAIYSLLGMFLPSFPSTPISISIHFSRKECGGIVSF